MSTRKPAGPRAGGAAATGGDRKKVASGAKGMSLRMLRGELARQKEQEEREREERKEKARREEESRKPTEEERRQMEEERRRRRMEEKKREGQRQMEAARRRLGVTVVATAGGGGDKRRPVYDSKRAKLQSKPHEHTQSEGDVEETLSFKPQLLGEQSKSSSHEEDTAIADALKLEEDSTTGSLEENSQVNDEDDDAWENKSLDEFYVTSAGQSPSSSEADETEKHAISAAPVVNSGNVAEEIEKDETNFSQGAASSSGPGDDRELRAPICCILGHVDAGKTKLFDCIRNANVHRREPRETTQHPNVQRRESGNITQQIGVIYLPAEYIRERTSLKSETTIKVPGLLIMDTPGHESFSKMRSRGLSMCDIAVVVVDITRGLEKQTIQCLDLLKRHNVRFIVALNKVDRLYGWVKCPDTPIQEALENQSADVKSEYKWRVDEVITQFKVNGFNTALHYENKKMKKVFSIVPTSATSGEGIPDLLLLLVRWVPEIMIEKLAYKNTVECTVLEVHEDKDLGTTIDVVLINGSLHQGDQVIVCTKQGPVKTIIRDLLTPHPMKDLTVKGIYKHHKELRAAQGIKVVARGLQHAIAGTSLIVVKPGDGLGQYEAAAMQDIDRAIRVIDGNEERTAAQEVSGIKTCKEGVYVQASSIGSLEAIIQYLKSNNVDIPVSDWNLGPVHKQDVMKATAMFKRKEEYAAILAFDVKVMPEAGDLAAESGVMIFMDDTIYKLVDSYTEHIRGLKQAKKMQFAAEAVFPCIMKILPNRVYHNKDPIVCDVEVLEGVVKVGTPICVCVPSKDGSGDIVHGLGTISSIKTPNGNLIFSASKGLVSIKIIGESNQEKSRSYGRHFDASDELLSQISRRSIDVLKEYYRDEMNDGYWNLILRLKNQFKIA